MTCLLAVASSQRLSGIKRRSAPICVSPLQSIQESHNVLNEVVIDRGAFPGPAVLDVFVDRTYVTTGEKDCGGGLWQEIPGGGV